MLKNVWDLVHINHYVKKPCRIDYCIVKLLTQYENHDIYFRQISMFMAGFFQKCDDYFKFNLQIALQYYYKTRIQYLV